MEKILIVDDSEQAIAIITEFIDSLGNPYKAAYNSIDAKYFIDKENFGLVICDFEMPGGNGDEVLDYIKGNKKEIDFVYFSGKYDLLVDIAPPLVQTFNDKSYEKLFNFLLKRYLK